jgi:hypothetical protein
MHGTTAPRAKQAPGTLRTQSINSVSDPLLAIGLLAPVQLQPGLGLLQLGLSLRPYLQRLSLPLHGRVEITRLGM